MTDSSVSLISKLLDSLSNLAKAYLGWIKKLVLVSFVVGLLSFFLLCVGFALESATLVKVSVMTELVVGFFFFLAISPTLLLPIAAYERSTTFQTWTRIIHTAMLWFLDFALYGLVVPLHKYPKAIPVVLICAAIVAVSLGWSLSRKLVAVRALMVLFATTAFSFIPSLPVALEELTKGLDAKIVTAFLSPHRIDYHPGLEFFDSATGKPKVWYHAAGAAKFELFDKPGYHPQTRSKLEVVTVDVVQIIETEYKKEQARKNAEEEQRKREQQRLEELKKEEEEKKAKAATQTGLLEPLEGSAAMPGGTSAGESQLDAGKVSQEQEPPIAQIVIPVGSVIAIRLANPLSTEDNRSGEEFVAYLDQPLRVGSTLVAEKGANVYGLITESRKAGRVKGVSMLALRLMSLETILGERAISSETLHFKGSTTYGSDAAKLGTIAGAGTATGAAAGGKKGAVAGAGAGAAIGAAIVMSTRGKSLSLPAEVLLYFHTDKLITIR